MIAVNSLRTFEEVVFLYVICAHAVALECVQQLAARAPDQQQLTPAVVLHGLTCWPSDIQITI